MPVFNTEAFLEESLKGILQQEYPCWELLLILDGGPEAVNASFWQSEFPDPRIRWLISQRNRGLSRSRNLAIRCAKGAWIAFCDSDDVWSPGKLAIQLKEARQGRYNVMGTGFVFVRQLPSLPSGQSGREMLRKAVLPTILDYPTLLATNPLPMSSAMYNAEELGKHYFNRSVGHELIHEDYAYWLNMFANPGVRPMLVQRPLVRIRIRSNSRSSNKGKAMRAHATILLEHLGPSLLSRVRILGYLSLYLFWAFRKRSSPWQAPHEFDWNR